MFVMSTVFQVINSSYNTKIFNMLVCIHLLYVCNVYSISGNQFFLQHKDLQYAGMYTSSVCLEYLQYFRKSLIKDNIFYSLMKLKDKDNQKY